ncbi:uncharacterized protein N7482_004529 [Penicillium canariense]|uniref:Uncharacterized protein n=1 Tax=Penicillium canariense TaxID=189055 RepID=A0A9W9I9B6_9EURO|nr:uncharacterized protein N7482_004529 [Penicillium canariense]KAJ5168935.1 hypothetical protein N7482_004529 [Penicillium canariense]
MRLFAGDIRSHATASALWGTLESTVVALFDHLYFPESSESNDLLPIAMDPIIQFWEWWILQESARRTVLLTFYFIQISKVLQGDIPVHCDGKLGLKHAWYMSAHLWNSQSAFDFAVAWAEKEHFVIRDIDFTVALEEARPDDVDIFARMLMVTIVGIDAAKAWFYARGAIIYHGAADQALANAGEMKLPSLSPKEGDDSSLKIKIRLDLHAKVRLELDAQIYGDITISLLQIPPAMIC